VCAETDPPATLTEHAKNIGAELLLIGHDFGYEAQLRQWRYWGPRRERHGLPHPALRGDYQLANAAACLTALDALHDRLPVGANDIRTGLLTAENPGRFQVLPGRPTVILDVAHNPAAATALRQTLARMPRVDRTFAVFAMLSDKDIRGVIDVVKPCVDAWFVSGLEGARGTSATTIAQELGAAGVLEHVSIYASVADAYAAACEKAGQNDRIVVFGSFHTVAAVMALRVHWQDR
jgi:dihydrofolate synthase/folylpolyglutamate synthase